MSDQIPTFSDIDFDAVNKDLEARASLARFADPEDVAASFEAEVDESSKANSNPGFVLDEADPSPEEVKNGGL